MIRESAMVLDFLFLARVMRERRCIMKRLRNCMVALLLGLSTPVLIWVGAGSAFYQYRKQAKLLKGALPRFTCAVDADCPPGFICINGHCMSEET